MKRSLRQVTGSLARLFGSRFAFRPRRPAPLLLDALEPRVLFSGAPVEEDPQSADSAVPGGEENPMEQGAIGDQTGSDQVAGEEATPESPVLLVETGGESAQLNAETLRTIAEAAKQRWIASGLTAEQIAALDSVTYEIADLGASHLGKASGFTITIDDDAAGTNAWFVDHTPDEDEEFQASSRPSSLPALPGGQAIGHVDLLTALLHEQGHILGLGDAESGLMGDTLGLGERKLPAQFGALLAVPGSLPSGAHYLTFSNQGQIRASDGADADFGNFGHSIAVSGDTAVIGAWQDDLVSENGGSAYIFTRTGSTWTQQAKLIAADSASDDSFGVSVAIAGDTVVIGAFQDDHIGGNDAGSAYVFTRTGSTWSQQAKLTASDASLDDRFGCSVAIAGNTAIIGAYFGYDVSGNPVGSTYIFTRSDTSWTQQAKLTASDAADIDYFGFSVAIDADTAVIGAYQDGIGPATGAGSAYVFTRAGSTWTQQAKLTASDPSTNDGFGFSVAVAGDTAIVGSYQDDHIAGSDAGSAYVFTRSAGVWTQQARLSASDAAGSDLFGYSVAISGDAVVVGARLGDHIGVDAGSAYVFTRSGATWTQQQKLAAFDATTNDRFGSSVAISGDTVVIGSYGDDHSGRTDAGSAYVFAVVPTTSAILDDGGNLTITDTLGGDTNDNLTIKVEGANYRITDAGNGIDKTIAIASVTGNITFDTLGGNDTLTVDYSGGAITRPVFFNGGTGGNDKLTITGGNTTLVTHTFLNANDGNVTLAGALAGTINYTGLEPVTDNLGALDRVFTFNGGAETITLTDAAGANMTIDSTLGESVTFAVPTGSLTINAGSGNDTVTITSVDGSYGAELTINGDEGNDTVNLNANITFAAGESLIINAETANTGANVTLTTSGAGVITITADDVALHATSALVSAGNVTIVQQTVARAINLGNNTGGQLSLTDAELNRITAGLVQIGDASSGNVTVGANLTQQSDLSITTGAGVTISRAITMAPDKDLTITALGTSNGTINLSGANADLSATGNGTVSLTTVRNVALAVGSSVTTVHGNLTISANQQANATSGNFVGVDLNGGLIQVTGTGTLTVDGRGGDNAVGSQYGVQVRGGGDIIGGGSAAMLVRGTGGLSSGNLNRGVYVVGGGATVTSSGGSVSVIGWGGGTATAIDNEGVYVYSGAIVTSGGNGTVTVEGTGGNSEGVGNRGVLVHNNGIISSEGGDVFVVGSGGGAGVSGSNYGIFVSSATISAGGNGNLTMIGTGGTASGNSNIGVVIDYEGVSISAGGNVLVIGQGGGTGNASQNLGITISGNDTQVVSTGNGTVSILGTGGTTGGNFNHGVSIHTNANVSSTINNVVIDGLGGGVGTSGSSRGVILGFSGTISAGGSGTLSVTGQGGAGSGVGNDGVQFYSIGTILSTEGGEINVVGIQGNGSGRFGIRMENGAAVSTAANGGNITLISDSMSFSTGSPVIETGAAGVVTLRHRTNGTQINLGAADSSGVLGLTDAELDRVTAGTLQIGDANSGNVTVSVAITRANATALDLASSAAIAFTTGSLDSAGGNVTLNAGTAIGVAKTGADVTATGATLAFGSGDDLNIVINGTTADTQHGQLNADANINLTGLDLLLSGNHTPVANQTFTIVNNTGNGTTSGTFNGLGEGATISNFLSSGLDATITYTGGDGNDVVLVAVAGVSLPPNTAFVAGNGTLVVTGDGDEDTVTIRILGGNVVVSTGDDSIIGGNGTTTNAAGDVLVPIGSFGDINLNTGGGNDTITLGNLTGLTGNVTVDGGAGHDVITVNGGETDLTGDVDFDAERVFLNLGSITTDGDIDIRATDTGDGTAAGPVDALELRGFDLTAGGDINLEGQAGNASGGTVGGNAGVELTMGSTITSGGNTTVSGTGGNSTDGTNHGVVLYSESSINATGNGSVTIEGVAGTGGFNNDGVLFSSGSGGASVVDGNLTLIGTGSTGGGYSDGVAIGARVELTANGTGTISLAGTGGGVGGGANSNGVALAYATVTTTSGDIVLAGISGIGLTSNVGLDIASSTLATTGGSIDLDGTSVAGGAAVNGTHNKGVQILTSDIQVTGAGTITIDGTGAPSGGEGPGSDSYSKQNDGVIIASTPVDTADGNLTIVGTSGGGSLSDGVDLGTGAALAAGNGSISITGNSTAGAGTSKSKGVTLAYATVTTDTGDITLIGTGGAGTTGNVGVDLAGNTTVVTSTGGGDISIDGTCIGNDIANTNVGVRLNNLARVEATGAGTLDVDGTGGSGLGNNVGVVVAGGGILRTGNGTLTVDGTGAGSGSGNRGVIISGATSRVETTGSGNLIVIGTGSAGTTVSVSGNSNDGVYITQTTFVQTLGTGNLSVTGNGGTGSTLNHGVRIVAAQVRAVGGGTVTILGIANGNTTGNSNLGVSITGATSAVTGADGSLIEGTGGGLTSELGTLNHGVHIDASITSILSGDDVEGTAGNGLTSLDRSGKYTP